LKEGEVVGFCSDEQRRRGKESEDTSEAGGYERP
jgi:hypothetical protein